MGTDLGVKTSAIGLDKTALSDSHFRQSGLVLLEVSTNARNNMHATN